MVDLNAHIIRELAVRIANLEVERATLLVKNNLLEEEVVKYGTNEKTTDNQSEKAN